jgi:predicted nucleotidyltransferase
MTGAPALTRENPVLAKFSAALAEMYGDRLERVVLFGSRARGDAQPDSDYDVAVFLNGMKGSADRWAELRRRVPRALPAHPRNPARGAGPVTPEAARFLQNADDTLNAAGLGTSPVSVRILWAW